jgi:hypothetical protein
MKRFALNSVLVLGAAVLSMGQISKYAPPEGDVISKIIGVKGDQIAGPTYDDSVYKISFPRTDVKVTVDGAPMPPFMGLTSWVAFMRHDHHMVMGDIVLFQDEVNPVMSVALENGLEVTALHNHFFYENPRVFFMHVGGEGSAEKLATGVQKMMAKIKEIRAASPEPAQHFGYPPIAEKSAITAKAIDDVLGVKGSSKDGMYKAVFGRSVKMPCGCEAWKEMGVNTWAAFQGTDEHARVDGDFIMFEGEMQGVLKALRRANINVVAIHNHMADENPRAMFLHYYGVGSTAELAKGIRAALDTQKNVGG